MKFRTLFVGLLLGLCVNGALVWGQETRAIISGTVTDPQRAVVVRAQVEIKNLETNVATKLETNESGRYTTPPVNPGQYSVSASAPGFRRTVRSNIELRVADRMLLDFQLELGATTDSITVTTEAPLLETRTATQSTTINSQLVADLPTYARDVFQLVRYTAGTQGGTTVRPFENSGNSATILGGSNSEVLLNGSPNTNRESSGVAGTTSPPPDAVSEIQVITNVYDAEYGRTGGGVISVSFKSGTNDYHGAAGWLVRNPILNANTFTANATGAPNASFRLNEPYAQLQGPVRIPGLYDGRNRTFFMYAIDIYRDSRPVGNTMTVPTDLQKQGDFSQTYVSGTSGPTVTIYDPTTTTQTPAGSYTRMPFAYNRVPFINPIAAKVVGFYLEPSQIAPRGQPNRGIYPSYDHEPFNSHASRFDHRLTDKHWVFVIITRDTRGQSFGGNAGLPAYQALGTAYASDSFQHRRGNVQGSFNLTSVISPTFVSTARASFNRHEFIIDPYSRGYDPTQLGFPASLASQVQGLSFPAFAVAGYGQLGMWDFGGNVLNYSNNTSIGETLSKTVGDHTIKFGGDARSLLNNQSTLPFSFRISTSAGFTQANPLVSSASSGDGLASFLLGYPSAVSSNYNSFPAQGQRYYGFFFQDDWRVTRKLTLNLGLRWEYESPITDRFNNMVNGFDPTTVTNLGSASGPQIKGGLTFVNSNHRLPYKRDWNNVAPRVGYAYQISSKLVARGGWAITYHPTADVAPYTGASITTSPSTSVANAGLVPTTTPGCTGNACGMLSNPFPTGILRPYGTSLGLQTNLGSSISYIWPDRSLPYSHTFSAGIQYQLPWRSVLQVSYSGRRARQVATSRSLNSVTYAQYVTNGANLTATSAQVTNPYAGLLPGTSLDGAKMTLQQSLLPYPQFTGITESGRSIGTSRYDAVLVQLEKRLSAGLSVLFTGTFQNSTTYSSYLNSGMDAIGQFITRQGGALPYVVNLSGTYSLPFFNNAKGLTKTLLGGWQLSGYGQWTPGGRLGVSGADSTGLDPALPKSMRTYQRWFNTCTFNMNTNTRQKCASADEPVAWIIQKPFTLITQPMPQWIDFRGRSVPDISLSLFKAFRIKERVRLELRADANNALNSPRFPSPNTSVTSGLFGVTTLDQSFTYDAYGPRQMQLGVRLSF